MSRSLKSLKVPKPSWLIRQWAAYIYHCRTACKLKRRDFADRCGVDWSYVTLWEQGYGPPRRHVVESIGRAVGDPTGALLAAGMIPEPGAVTGMSLDIQLERIKRLPSPPVPATLPEEQGDE